MAQTYAKWGRVNRRHPCDICGKPDWCGYSDGMSICMRVESDRPTRNGGWLHGERPAEIHLPPPRHDPRPVLHNPLALYKGWERETDYQRLDGFAMSLGVDTESLKAIGCAWARTAWAFPMKDESGTVVGIRLRSDEGRKWAITGSRQGLFIPTSHPYCVDDATFYIVEGPTDLAAAMTIGLHAIGRPSCLGHEETIIKYLRSQKTFRVVIVSDNDAPGLQGARRLQEQLKQRSCIWTPPCKDMREFVSRGGTAPMIESAIRDLVWNIPEKQHERS